MKFKAAFGKGLLSHSSPSQSRTNINARHGCLMTFAGFP
jgi:hypothetical protein